LLNKKVLITIKPGKEKKKDLHKNKK